MLFRFFSFLAHLKPHALHSVFGPLGPFLHSGESSVPRGNGQPIRSEMANATTLGESLRLAGYIYIYICI